MLKLEVAIPAAPAGMDYFDFCDARPMPFLSAPSTPKPFGPYSLSTPTSPSRVAEFNRRLDDDFNGGGGEGRSSGVPFLWEERPAGTLKSPPRAPSRSYVEDDFAFDFSAELEKASLSADELFDGGKIKPLKPPPALQLDEDSTDQRSPLISPRSPRSPIARGRKIISEVFSPRKKKDSDPFATAAENTRKRAENERGRERISSSSNSRTTSSSRRRRTRSLSPFRVAEFPWEEEEEAEEEKQQEQTAKQSAAVLNQNASISSNSSTSKSGSSKKWRLRDFLLFRSASEGRASGRDPFRRYHQAHLIRKHEEEAKNNTSFRSTTDSESGSVRKGRLSAHELHYKTNKAASEDSKKKTFLPYKQAILGIFAFNPTIPALR